MLRQRSCCSHHTRANYAMTPHSTIGCISDNAWQHCRMKQACAARLEPQVDGEGAARGVRHAVQQDVRRVPPGALRGAPEQRVAHGRCGVRAAAVDRHRVGRQAADQREEGPAQHASKGFPRKDNHHATGVLLMPEPGCTVKQQALAALPRMSCACWQCASQRRSSPTPRYCKSQHVTLRAAQSMVLQLGLEGVGARAEQLRACDLPRWKSSVSLGSL